MNIRKKSVTVAAGLALAGSMLAYASTAEARFCSNTSPNWTTETSCPGTSDPFGKGWGSTTTRIGGIPFRVKSVNAWFLGAGGGYADAVALDSSGHGIAGCEAIDYGPADLYPASSGPNIACQTGARVYLGVSY